MNKISYFFSTATVFLFLSACSGEYVCKCLPNCVFPDTDNVAAPEWVCGAEIEGIQLTAVGIATQDKAAIGHSYMRAVAGADARTQLAQRMRELARNSIKKYFETESTPVDLQVMDKIITSVTQYITDKTLIGQRTLKREISPAGRMYALFGMNSESVEHTLKKALTLSKTNDPELWLQFKSSKNLDDLAGEIAKFK